MLKRGYVGVYHQMSAKHLHRYASEFKGRHNSRSNDTINQVHNVIRGHGRKTTTGIRTLSRENHRRGWA